MKQVSIDLEKIEDAFMHLSTDGKTVKVKPFEREITSMYEDSDDARITVMYLLKHAIISQPSDDTYQWIGG